MTVKNCMTCGHRDGRTFTWAKCMYIGFYCESERKYPIACGRNFEAWVQRDPSLFEKLVSAIKGRK